MKSAERATLFGDIRGISAKHICLFKEATDHLHIGSYPNREQDLSDEEVERKTRELLLEAGVLDSLITLCDSIEERATRILQDCSLHRMQSGISSYWILDSNPSSLLGAIKSVMSNDNFQVDILRSTTIITLGSQHSFDYIDNVTGVRIAALPVVYRFPTHPTPAS